MCQRTQADIRRKKTTQTQIGSYFDEVGVSKLGCVDVDDFRIAVMEDQSLDKRRLKTGFMARNATRYKADQQECRLEGQFGA